MEHGWWRIVILSPASPVDINGLYRPSRPRYPCASPRHREARWRVILASGAFARPPHTVLPQSPSTTPSRTLRCRSKCRQPGRRPWPHSRSTWRATLPRDSQPQGQDALVYIVSTKIARLPDDDTGG